MEEHQKPIPTKTTVSLSKDTIAKLRLLMKYGDSYSSAIDRLLSAYAQIAHVDVKKED